MAEMPDHDVSTIDAICARLQSDLQAQMSKLEEREREVREQVQREAVAQTAKEWTQRVEAVRTEWQERLQAELAAAASAAERTLAAETQKVRAEVERSAAEAAERTQKEAAENVERVRREAAESNDQVRRETEAAVSQAIARVRGEMEQAAVQSTSRLREEMGKEATLSTARVRDELEQALAVERGRFRSEMDAERARAHKELASERDRTSVELETERLKVKTLTAAIEEAQTTLARERENVRSAAEAIQARDLETLTEARAIERQSQLALVEQISGGIRTIGLARSLSDTLTALTSSASTLAPRVALFIVNGKELQGWRAVGFGDNGPASLRLSLKDSALLSTATKTGAPVPTSIASAPAFAALPGDRAGLAVPITVGGQSVAVLYADDGSPQEPEAPASWPEAIQILGAHASVCLALTTAVRTTQAMRATAAGAGRAAPPGPEEDGSARRYARLLVSEIKLYNEAAVRMGREKRDLLNRLRPEIEKARRLYEERVSPSVGARGAYFQQELVHTLAAGDASLLGDTV
jgi:hypothetical protein